ncbi:MAG: SPOR domain-containing protein [Ignavibacteriae bacterium]|nr:SPOR domain-containing protein [Ignavibacteriota bacterium]
MKNIFIILLIFSFSACSIFQSSEEEEQKAKSETEEVYVFDEVDQSKDKTKNVDELKKEVDNTFDDDESKDNLLKSSEHGFFLQLGAFSTKSRAEQFMAENESKVPFRLSIVYNNTNALYTVRSTPYKTKSEAQMVRDGFWNQNMFKDAFIVTE